MLVDSSLWPGVLWDLGMIFLTKGKDDMRALPACKPRNSTGQHGTSYRYTDTRGRVPISCQTYSAVVFNTKTSAYPQGQLIERICRRYDAWCRSPGQSQTLHRTRHPVYSYSCKPVPDINGIISGIHVLLLCWYV